MTLRLEEDERAMLAGEAGDGARLAMRIVVAMADAADAERLLPISGAHIDGCLYHGPVGVAFAERLADAGATVRVPTTLNVSALDLLHPDLVRLPVADRDAARRQMTAYERVGCRPTWTCAPYQLPERPGFGDQVAWAESNAIVFANSVLGARTDRYGDFIDICAAITGRVPAAGLHLDEHRRGEVLFRLRVPEPALDEDALYPLLGHVIGLRAGTLVPVIEGLPGDVSEDRLKSLGAAAASSGSVALVHVVGRTPEAPTLADAFAGSRPARTVDVGTADLREAASQLSTGPSGPLRAVSVGTPHLSLAGIERLAALLDGRRVHPTVAFYASTGRDVLRAARDAGLADRLEEAGVTFVVDTCTYITPIISAAGGAVMTDSAKWAWYAPANLGVDVAFGSTADCVRSAVEGRVVRELGWLDG